MSGEPTFSKLLLHFKSASGELSEPLGLVAFPFGLCKKEPNPCNQRLAQAVTRIVTKEPAPLGVVAQWEIASALEDTAVKVDEIEGPTAVGTYLDSVIVWGVA